MSLDHLDAMTAQAVALEFEKLVTDLRERARECSSADTATGILLGALTAHVRAAELRAYAKERADKAEAALRAVARVDRARNYGIGDTDG